ncbi:hypothetical protein ZIOFF_046908 [Zingiber officinale]|uniref:X8 domain-containing protein n=1 Tax=Zingiber officinale TaxID=94328 RepID=A0A8J5FU23_ZINOF|nr:hypothetical protein ZIOFF_046908 [Zingiber officinale]
MANPGATTEKLQANIQYACSIADCSVIQVGGPCYSTDIFRQASYAMNAYYNVVGHAEFNCYFNGTGAFILKDASCRQGRLRCVEVADEGGCGAWRLQALAATLKRGRKAMQGVAECMSENHRASWGDGGSAGALLWRPKACPTVEAC